MTKPEPRKSEPVLKVLVSGASLREDSLNGKLAALAARVAEQSGATVDHASIRDFDVPTYDGDVEREHGLPMGAGELRRRLSENDAFIVSSPEYTTLQLYYGAPGRMADTLRQVLLERAKAGVRVFVLYDAFGTVDIPTEHRDALRAGGIRVEAIRPVRLSTRSSRTTARWRIVTVLSLAQALSRSEPLGKLFDDAFRERVRHDQNMVVHRVEGPNVSLPILCQPRHNFICCG